jgi:hypothetical protein
MTSENGTEKVDKPYVFHKTRVFKSAWYVRNHLWNTWEVGWTWECQDCIDNGLHYTHWVFAYVRALDHTRSWN